MQSRVRQARRRRLGDAQTSAPLRSPAPPPPPSVWCQKRKNRPSVRDCPAPGTAFAPDGRLPRGPRQVSTRPSARTEGLSAQSGVPTPGWVRGPQPTLPRELPPAARGLWSTLGGGGGGEGPSVTCRISRSGTESWSRTACPPAEPRVPRAHAEALPEERLEQRVGGLPVPGVRFARGRRRQGGRAGGAGLAPDRVPVRKPTPDAGAGAASSAPAVPAVRETRPSVRPTPARALLGDCGQAEGRSRDTGDAQAGQKSHGPRPLPAGSAGDSPPPVSGNGPWGLSGAVSLFCRWGPETGPEIN